MNDHVEAARDRFNLTELRDPILFGLITHHSERWGKDQAHVVMSHAYPNVITLEEWKQDFEPAVVNAMAATLKDKAPEPEAVAVAALRVFRDDLARRAVSYELAGVFLDIDADFSGLHAVTAEAQRILSTWSPESLAVLFVLLEDRGVSLLAFQAALTEMAVVTAGNLRDIKLDPGRRREPANKALLQAGYHLIEEHSLERACAARALAAMLDAHPDFEAKSANAIEQALYNEFLRRSR